MCLPSSLDASSENDEPVEDEEFVVNHKEWIEKVMKDEMSFTVYLDSSLRVIYRSLIRSRKATVCVLTPPTW